MIAGGLHHNPQAGAAIDGETIATTAARARETMTTGALAGIAHDVILLAARLGKRVGEETETETDAIEHPGNDLQVLQMSKAEDADTAAIDTAKTVIAIGIVTGHQEDTEARDDGLVPPNGHQAHGHWNDATSDAPPPEKEKPNFKNTGRLAAETNTIQTEDGQGVVLKYHEPPEARKPPAKEPWRMYVFKGEELLEMVELGERSCWLIGRERLVVDFPLDHPSCSKQHAAIQFRFVEKRNEYGDRIGKVKPYLIDLESANGSTVNGEAAPAGRYMEVMDKDVLRFGLSSREYVLMLPSS
ncbi:uncharacterized protein N7498_003297 [Penicillium cinerascens]|uniref:FHA domain-containing protein n=1 Tax=Penicillium cinerascens TaxID=70096 RepID=A0A9W9N200_9EURO|nr:uncharacterized protein N7498_003297 [Penicillium cinerascens]KAJ5211651.1 hypothetical protein N7498_003297 [Penicillium cinerascens]